MPELLDLPDACLAIILQHLPTAHSLASAMATHSQIAAVGHSYPETWRPLAEQVAWCLRRRCDEGWGELCKRAHCGAARQRLVAIGGAQQIFIPSIDDAAVDVYEIGNEASDGAWQAANPLGRARDAPCAASDGRRVHVLGGWDGKADCALTCGESAEFDEHGIALCWEALPELPEPRCFAAAVCDEQERLWVVGGGDSLYRGARCLSAVDLLMGDGWSRAGTLLEPRCGLALAASTRRSELVVCGGYSGGGLHARPHLYLPPPRTVPASSCFDASGRIPSHRAPSPLPRCPSRPVPFHPIPRFLQTLLTLARSNLST